MFEGLTTRAGWALFHPTLPVLCAGDGKVPSGSGSGLDPDSMGSLDPYPDPDSRSGSRRAKMTH